MTLRIGIEAEGWMLEISIHDKNIWNYQESFLLQSYQISGIGARMDISLIFKSLGSWGPLYLAGKSLARAVISRDHAPLFKFTRGFPLQRHLPLSVREMIR
jgi:hypothetical protein